MASTLSPRARVAPKPNAAPAISGANADTRVALIFLAIALILGGAVRLYSIVQMPFAFGDGGMFWVATRAILNANFALPPTLAYPTPTSQLPFCYPPLGFYTAAILTKVGLPLEFVFRWLPWTWSMATTWAFWRLARTFWRHQPNGAWAAGAATLCWALLPWSFFWMIMGGGLTRALGLLCAFLAIDAALKLWRDTQTKQWIGLTIFLALAMASHLERARFAVRGCRFGVAVLRIIPAGALQLAGAFLGAAILSAPWWGLVFDAFWLSAVRGGGAQWRQRLERIVGRDGAASFGFIHAGRRSDFAVRAHFGRAGFDLVFVAAPMVFAGLDADNFIGRSAFGAQLHHRADCAKRRHFAGERAGARALS